MKKDIHPDNYQLVIFEDTSSEDRFLIGTTVTIEGDEKAKWEDGTEYPLVRVDVSSATHPFYTGTEKVMDTAGRVERFKKMAARKGKK